MNLRFYKHTKSPNCLAIDPTLSELHQRVYGDDYVEGFAPVHFEENAGVSWMKIGGEHLGEEVPRSFVEANHPRLIQTIENHPRHIQTTEANQHMNREDEKGGLPRPLREIIRTDELPDVILQDTLMSVTRTDTLYVEGGSMRKGHYKRKTVTEDGERTVLEWSRNGHIITAALDVLRLELAYRQKQLTRDTEDTDG